MEDTRVILNKVTQRFEPEGYSVAGVFERAKFVSEVCSNCPYSNGGIESAAGIVLACSTPGQIDASSKEVFFTLSQAVENHPILIPSLTTICGAVIAIGSNANNFDQPKLPTL